jgi:phenylalanyl-tRNA synthetase beta chain
MILSLNWLSRHLDLGTMSVPELSELLTFAGVEVEGIHESGLRSDKVVTARIVSFEKHPNADRLSVCQVDDGSGQARQIVCGAKNFQAGDVVPLALPGAVLPGDFTIKSSKLRGVLSEGMLCSGREINVVDDADGLLLLPRETATGQLFQDLVPPDVRLEVEITPNRPDLLSHRGMARELAALTGLPLLCPAQLVGDEKATRRAGESEINLEMASGCPYYTARIIRGVKIGPSPRWLEDALRSIGLRPVNNVVDVTNFLLHDLGQPLHAFDLAQLQGGLIRVRAAYEGEKFQALDEKTYQLETGDLVIADETRAVALAGVMGGKDSGVGDETTDILLESAWFLPSMVRRTSRRLGLSSDSSYRFERGVDAGQVLGVSEEAVRLILEVAGGKAEPVTLVAGEPPMAESEVVLDHDGTRRLLGAPTSTEFMIQTLERLGLSAKSVDDQVSHWQIPSWRLDLQRPVDLIEEIARVQGLDPIPARLEGGYALSSDADRAYDHAMALRRRCVASGLYEARTIKLISAAHAEAWAWNESGEKEILSVKLPLSDDHSTLRPSLIPGLLDVAARNIRMGAKRLAFFEMGRVFAKNAEGAAWESDRVAFLLAGPEQAVHWTDNRPRLMDFADASGLIASLVTDGVVGFERITREGLSLAAKIVANGQAIGWVGQLPPSRAIGLLDVTYPVFVAELDLALLRGGHEKSSQVLPLPRFPSMTRDVAVEVAASLPQQALQDFFATTGEPLLVEARLFDVFVDVEGKRMAADRKSLAYTLVYQNAERTMESAEVDQAHGKILAKLRAELPVAIR